MKKLIWATALLTALLLSTLTGTLFVELVNANFVPGDPPVGTLILPENKLYTENSVPITVRWSMANNDYRVQVAGVALLNGRSSKTLVSDGVPRTEVIDKDLYTYYYYFDSVLTEVPDGVHTLKVTVTCSFYGKYDENWKSISYERYLGSWIISSDSKGFTVSTAPVIQVSSKNLSSDVFVKFIVNKPLQSLSYSLDGKNRVTLDSDILVKYPFAEDVWRGNLTLTGLSDGLHSLTVYGTGDLGLVGNATIDFTVNQQPEPTQQQETEQSFLMVQTATIGGIVLAATAATLGLIVCFRKRKRQQS